MKINYTTFDGNNQAGIGSLLQLQQHLYAYCKIENIGMFFPGFTRLNHYQPFNISQEKFCENLNNFFNFNSVNSSDENISFVAEDFLIKRWGEINNKIKKTYIEQLANNIRYDGKIDFDSNRINVVIHIRVDNPQDNGLVIPQIEMYKKGNFKQKYFKNVLRK